jgi:RNA polymerase sigma-70 factor (ECF subfamily)
VDYAALPIEELVLACAQTNKTPAWEEFVRRFQPLISTVALRTARLWGDPAANAIDDLVQETYLKICANDCRLLRNFRPQHPGAFFGYLKMVTANVVHDHFKAAHAVKRGAGEVTENLDPYDRDTALAREISLPREKTVEYEILLTQIDACLSRCVPAGELARSRRIFWLYYRCGLTASAIASLPGMGLTTKGVESTLLRLNRLVRGALAEVSTKRKGDSKSPPAEKGLRPAGSF